MQQFLAQPLILDLQLLLAVPRMQQLFMKAWRIMTTDQFVNRVQVFFIDHSRVTGR